MSLVIGQNTVGPSIRISKFSKCRTFAQPGESGFVAFIIQIQMTNIIEMDINTKILKMIIIQHNIS